MTNEQLNFDSENPFLYENGFYLTSSPDRIRKFLVHYELFKKTIELPGDIIEVGVFKGASFCRFTKYRDIFHQTAEKKMIGFDIFGVFPLPTGRHIESDKEQRDSFVEIAGQESMSIEALQSFLEKSGSGENIDFVAGDVIETVPTYTKENPNLQISLLHLDVDYYDTTRVCLENFYDKVVSGGLILLDDYNDFAGATDAANEFFSAKNLKIEQMWDAPVPYFVVKP